MGTAVVAEFDASPSQTALPWLAHRDGITAPIVGARTVDQLEENLATNEIDRSEEQVDRLTEAKQGSYPGL